MLFQANPCLLGSVRAHKLAAGSPNICIAVVYLDMPLLHLKIQVFTDPVNSFYNSFFLSSRNNRPPYSSILNVNISVFDDALKITWTFLLC